MRCTPPKKKATASDLRDAIAKELLDPLRESFQSYQKVHFIVDTPDKDADFLQDCILTEVRARLGEPFIVDFAEVGSGVTLVQDLLAMVFLKSEFPVALLSTKKKGTQIEIFRIFYEKTDQSLLETVQRFLECKRLNDHQKRKLNIDSDLSDFRNAVGFFAESVHSYFHYAKKMPVFYFRNPKLEKDGLKAHSTTRFFTEVQKEIPCVFVLKVLRDTEYLLLYVEDYCTITRLPALDSEHLSDSVSRICKTSRSRRKARFTEEGLREFCSVMSHIHGKTLSASALTKALLDAEGHAKLNNSETISAETVRELFSVATVNVTRPKPREPRIGLSPYFATEVERLTKQCRIFGLDPHYALPWNFKKVMSHINYGSLRYCQDSDTFETLRYIGHQYWLDLDSALRLMGYRYAGGGKWVFSPRGE